MSYPTIKILVFSAVSLFLWTLSGCSATLADPYRTERQAVLQALEPAQVFPSLKSSSSPELNFYRQQWQNRLGNVKYQQTILTLKSDDKLLCLNLFEPRKKSKGTVFVLHGYLANSLTFASLDAEFLRQGWTVTSIDLPGHGLSQGPRADIDTWSRYGDAVQSWLDWAQSQPIFLPRPWIMIAHSLGGASVIDDYSRRLKILPDCTVLVAPLVHTTWYEPEKISYFLTGWAIRQLPPFVPAESYLGIQSFPTHWFKELTEWNKSLTLLKPWGRPQGVILQGTEDSIVDGIFNTRFLSRVFPGLKVEFLPGLDHVMLTEPNERKMAWGALFGYLMNQGFQVHQP
jgi:lysophospholipase